MAPRSVRFSDEVDAALVARAEVERRSVSWLVQEAVAAFLRVDDGWVTPDEARAVLAPVGVPSGGPAAVAPRRVPVPARKSAPVSKPASKSKPALSVMEARTVAAEGKVGRAPVGVPLGLEGLRGRAPVGSVRCRRCDWWSPDVSLKCPVHEMGSLVR